MKVALTITTALTPVQAGDFTIGVGIQAVPGTSPSFKVYDANQTLLATIEPNGSYVWPAAAFPGQIVGYAATITGTAVLNVTDQNVFPRAVPYVRPLIVMSASGAIAMKDGTVFLNKAGVAVMTLPLPIPGVDDNKILEIVALTAQANTVTTPAAGLNATSTVATFGAAIGNNIRLRAYGGSWYVVSQVGITLS